MQNGVRIQRERRDTLSRSRDISREEGRREIWENGNEVSTRRRRDEIQPVDNRGNSIRNNEQSERGSSSKSGSNIRAIRERETTHKSNEHNSLISRENAVATDSRGNSSERDCIPNKIKNIEQIDIFESQQSGSFLLPEIEKQTKENSQKINYKYNPEDEISLTYPNYYLFFNNRNYWLNIGFMGYILNE